MVLGNFLHSCKFFYLDSALLSFSNFCRKILMFIKNGYVGHFSHSIFVPEYKFEFKIEIFQQMWIFWEFQGIGPKMGIFGGML